MDVGFNNLFNDTNYHDKTNAIDSEAIKTCNVRTVKGSQELFIGKVANLFPAALLAELAAEVASAPSLLTYKDKMRHIIFNRNFVPNPILFDSEGRVALDTFSMKDLDGRECTGVIKKAAHIAVERMGKELGWKGIHEVSMNILRYELSVGENTPPVEWHNDTFAHHSMVILLNDSNAIVNGWTGGDFCFTGALKVAQDMPNRLQWSDLKGKQRSLVLLDPNSPCLRIHPAVNAGVLFSNVGTMHSVTPMRAYSKEGKSIVVRSIMTLFSRLPEEEEKPSPVGP